MPKSSEKVGNFYSLCLLHVSCNSVQKEIISSGRKNYCALFWYINKLVPNCTEATVLLNVYPVFVSKFDFDCESNIRQHSAERIYTTLSKMFLLFSSSFLPRIQQKKK